MSKKTLVFATNNPHKLAEARAIIGEMVEVKSLSDIGCSEELPETSDTLEGNALQKARYVAEHYRCDCFADDTGLLVDALGGAPGVYTARYAGPQCNSDDNIARLLSELEGKPGRTARFSTVVALIEQGHETLLHGSVEGTIATERHGTAGFGYDPVFIPVETGVCFAQMDAEAKNAISHRGRAMRAMLAHLKSGQRH